MPFGATLVQAYVRSPSPSLSAPASSFGSSSAYSAASGSRTEYSSRIGVPAPVRSRVRSIAISGTSPEPPATSCTGSDCSGRQTNQPPSGPRISSTSPTATTWVRYGDTSPSSSPSTVTSTVVPSLADAIEYDRVAE